MSRMDIEQWHNDRISEKPSVRDLIKGMNGHWKREGYKVKIDHDSTWHPRKGVQEFHVVAHSPAGKEVGRYTFHHDGKSLRVDGADTHTLHQRKGLATEAYRMIQQHTGLKVQPGAIQTDAGAALWQQPQKKFGGLAKAVDKDEFHNTLDEGKSPVGGSFVDHMPHMNLKADHAQYVQDVQHPDVKMPSGMFDSGISPKLVHKMPYGTFMMKPFHEQGMAHSGLATMTAQHLYKAGNIGHLNEDASATTISHPENPSEQMPVVISKFNPHASHMNEVPASIVNPKEAGQIGVMDYLMGNDDRHSQNSMVQRNKQNAEGLLSPLAIDHGFSFTYGSNNNLQDMIDTSHRYGGHGQSANYATDEHVGQIKDWYKEHGDKMHSAMMHSTDSIKDDNLKTHIRANYTGRHNALKQWANDPKIEGKPFDGVESQEFDHETERGEAAIDAMDGFDIGKGENLHQLKEIFDKHKPTGFNQDIFFANCQNRLHDVNPQALADYFAAPVKHEDDRGFKNQLLHRLITTGDRHPQHKQVMLNILAENKNHPDHAKPIHPYTQKLMERLLHRPDVPTWGGAHAWKDAK